MSLLADNGGAAVDGDIDPSIVCALLGLLLVSAVGLAAWCSLHGRSIGRAGC